MERHGTWLSPRDNYLTLLLSLKKVLSIIPVTVKRIDPPYSLIHRFCFLFPVKQFSCCLLKWFFFPDKGGTITCYFVNTYPKYTYVCTNTVSFRTFWWFLICWLHHTLWFSVKHPIIWLVFYNVLLSVYIHQLVILLELYLFPSVVNMFLIYLKNPFKPF